MFRIKSETWGWLEATDVKVVGPFLQMLNVTRDGKPFYADCSIPVSDAKLIVPSKG